MAGPSSSPATQSTLAERRELTLDAVSFPWQDHPTLGQDPGLVAASLDGIFSPGQTLPSGPSHASAPTALVSAERYNWASTATPLSSTQAIEDLPIDTTFGSISATDTTAAWQLFWSLLPMVSDQTPVSAPFDPTQPPRLEEEAEQIHINWHSLDSAVNGHRFTDINHIGLLTSETGPLASTPTTLTAESVVLCAAGETP